MIVDAHCHIVPPSFAERRRDLAARDATFAAILANPAARIADAPGLLRAMSRDGVDHAVAMGMGWADYEVAVEANDCLIEAVADNPSRITGFVSVNPAWGDAAVDEAQRCAAAGLRGIGELHPDTQGIDITDAAEMSPLMDFARSRDLPVLLHCSEPVGHQYPGKGKTTPDKVLRLIENFPDNTIICAHWGGGLPFYGLMPEVGAALRNVYFDSAASPFLYRPGIYRTAADAVGADRILFASDYPLMPHSRPLSELAGLSLPESHRRLILGGNAERLLGLCEV
jgi:predicted TIM-barrel fold metal-dependent hydrolase